ncbi:hypothetical protein [Variovorax sp. YR266]|uniref:hypothetical protein n=1 Tax=Variovorax sp. YR266 TaxID=1884386 RepID=UPI0015A078EC|nr:hypothetical protein [Variovorax sp. YR266]
MPADEKDTACALDVIRMNDATQGMSQGGQCRRGPAVLAHGQFLSWHIKADG